MTDFDPHIVENYITNADEILQYVQSNDHLFTRRIKGHQRAHSPSINGPTSQFSSIFYDDMSEEFRDMCLRTIPQDRKWLSQIVINKYEPGDFLVKHKDSQGGYYRFKLIWLTQGPPHFCWYDQHDKPHLVQEKTGAMFDMDIGLAHEVTQIGDGEPTKYSMCLIWR